MVRIAVLGDFDPSNITHTATTDALHHAGDAGLEVKWIGTDVVSRVALDDFDGVWCSPGSPYASLEGALSGIRWARERSVPFIGTCAGFQHAILEFARNVCGFGEAMSEEYDAGESPLFITRLECSLAGKRMRIRVTPGTLAAGLYRAVEAEESYYCNFGFNETYRAEIESGGLRFTGRSEDGEARILELPDHPFFLATLFVPQTASRPGNPHPLIGGFVDRAAAYRRTRGRSDLARA